MQWYYIKDGEQQGPIDEPALKAMVSDGSIKADDKVWNESFGEEWISAGNVSELNTASATPPDLPKQPTHSPAPYIKPDRISCTTVVTPAFERMKDILFRPFDMAKWFALGVSAWLATLGQGGGNSSGGGGGDNGGLGNPGGSGGFDFEAVLDKGREFIGDNPWIIPLVVVITIVLFALGIVITWLRSRGKFMLLDNVVTNQALISEPWKKFKQHGNSLFLWSMGYYFVCLIIFAVIAGLVYASVMPCIAADDLLPYSAVGILLAIILLLTFFITCGYISRFLEDFVVPIMYRQNLTTTEAWKEFGGIIKPHKGAFILYGMFYILLAMGAGMALVLCVVLTCCIALCPLAIPYVGSVLLLPITVFFRAYSLEYLAQFGEKYHMFDKFPGALNAHSNE